MADNDDAALVDNDRLLPAELLDRRRNGGDGRGVVARIARVRRYRLERTIDRLERRKRTNDRRDDGGVSRSGLFVARGCVIARNDRSPETRRPPVRLPAGAARNASARPNIARDGRIGYVEPTSGAFAPERDTAAASDRRAGEGAPSSVRDRRRAALRLATRDGARLEARRRPRRRDRGGRPKRPDPDPRRLAGAAARRSILEAAPEEARRSVEGARGRPDVEMDARLPRADVRELRLDEIEREIERRRCRYPEDRRVARDFEPEAVVRAGNEFDRLAADGLRQRALDVRASASTPRSSTPAFASRAIRSRRSAERTSARTAGSFART